MGVFKEDCMSCNGRERKLRTRGSIKEYLSSKAVKLATKARLLHQGQGPRWERMSKDNRKKSKNHIKG